MISPARLQLPRASSFAVARVEPSQAPAPLFLQGTGAWQPSQDTDKGRPTPRSLDVNHFLRVGSWSLHGAVWREACQRTKEPSLCSSPGLLPISE